MSWIHLSDTLPKARKQYRCELCGVEIPKGMEHVARRGIGDDGPITFRMHKPCEVVTRDWDESDWESCCGDTVEFGLEMADILSKEPQDD